MTGTTEAFSRVQIDVLLKDAGGSVLFEHALTACADYTLCDRAGGCPVRC